MTDTQPVMPHAEAAVAGSEIGQLMLKSWKTLAGAAVAGGLLGVGISFLVKPSFVARTTIMAPQQQSAGLSALTSQLGSLSGLAGLGGVRSTADQYVSFLASTTLSDRIIDQFKLMDLYDMTYRSDLRKKLTNSIATFTSNKKDGLITIEVQDHDPKRAADMANAYVVQLRAMTDKLAVTEAKQRRVFFEKELTDTKERLTQAQLALQNSGVTDAAIKTEPQGATATYARLRAELTAAEIRQQALSSALTAKAPEVLAQQAVVSALRRQLGALETSQESTSGTD